jgi:quercetin dioxygenase-like cupin family protein
MPNRRDVLKLAAGANAFALFAETTGALRNSVVDGTNAKITQEKFGEQWIYFNGQTGQLKSMTAGGLHLKPGMAPHPPHEHPDEEFMVVTEGTGEVTIEGKITKVGPGSMMYCGANKVHGIVNSGKTPMLAYYYKWKA